MFLAAHNRKLCGQAHGHNIWSSRREENDGFHRWCEYACNQWMGRSGQILASILYIAQWNILTLRNTVVKIKINILLRFVNIGVQLNNAWFPYMPAENNFWFYSEWQTSQINLGSLLKLKRITKFLTGTCVSTFMIIEYYSWVFIGIVIQYVCTYRSLTNPQNNFRKIRAWPNFLRLQLFIANQYCLYLTNNGEHK